MRGSEFEGRLLEIGGSGVWRVGGWWLEVGGRGWKGGVERGVWLEVQFKSKSFKISGLTAAGLEGYLKVGGEQVGGCR